MVMVMVAAIDWRWKWDGGGGDGSGSGMVVNSWREKISKKRVRKREKTDILEKVGGKSDRLEKERENTDILEKGGGKSDRLEKEREKTDILEKGGGKSDRFENESEKSDRFEKESEKSDHLEKKSECDKAFKKVDIQSEKEREGDTSVESIENQTSQIEKVQNVKKAVVNPLSGLISLSDAELYRKFLMARIRGEKLPDGYTVLKDVFQGEQDPVDMFRTPLQQYVYFFKQTKQLSTASDAGANKNFDRKTRTGNRWKVDKGRMDIKGTSGSRSRLKYLGDGGGVMIELSTKDQNNVTFCYIIRVVENPVNKSNEENVVEDIILPPNASVRVDNVIEEKSSIDHAGGLEGTEVEGVNVDEQQLLVESSNALKKANHVGDLEDAIDKNDRSGSNLMLQIKAPMKKKRKCEVSDSGSPYKDTIIFLLLKQGEVEEDRKNYEQAVIYYCKALELDLNNTEVKKALKKAVPKMIE